MPLEELSQDERSCDNCGFVPCKNDLGRMHGYALTPRSCGWVESTENRFIRAVARIAELEAEVADLKRERDEAIVALEKFKTE